MLEICRCCYGCRPPLSAYQLFVKERMPQIRAANPTVNVNDNMQELSKAWRDLSEDAKSVSYPRFFWFFTVSRSLLNLNNCALEIH
jgi:hypothetical protein